MSDDEEERRVGMDELHVALGVNNELIKHVVSRVVGQTEDLAQLKATIGSIVRDEKIHDTHHQWVEAQVELAKDKAKFWKGVSEKIATAGIWSAILLVCGVLWYAIKQFIKNGGATS